MATYQIQFSYNQMMARADKLEKLADQLLHAVNQALDIINVLRPTFLGIAASAFFKLVDSYVHDMQKWDKIIRQLADEIRRHARILHATDLSRAGK